MPWNDLPETARLSREAARRSLGTVVAGQGQARALLSVRTASSMTATLSKQVREQTARALSRNRHCPRCAGAITRVRRHTIDRVIAVIFPRHRYRCKSLQCTWEGTLPFTKL
jgi:hypothetical protein